MKKLRHCHLMYSRYSYETVEHGLSYEFIVDRTLFKTFNKF